MQINDGKIYIGSQYEIIITLISARKVDGVIIATRILSLIM